MRKKTALKLLLGSVLAVTLGAGGYLGALQLTGNFHEVIPGVYYRSAQLSGSQFDSYLKRYGIKTVINLRGPHPGEDWYDAEVAAARSNDALHIDLALSARHDLTEDQSKQLLAILKDAAQPVLVHCQGGADRTGLASVMYLQQVAGVPEEKAERQLSVVYGHIGLPFLRVYAMDRSWGRFEKEIGLQNSQADNDLFGLISSSTESAT